MTRYYCTLFDKNYLTRGLALYLSLMRFAKPFRLWVLCMDDLTYEILSKLKLRNVSLIKLTKFEDKKLLKVKPRRTHGEYCWTCTPSLPLYIFKNFPNIKMVSYLDSDLYFYSSPNPIFKEFGNESIMIIPHRFSGNVVERERNSGIYNVGMMIFRNNKYGLNCLNWWRERCLEKCTLDLKSGFVGDQKYLDLFPKLFKGVHILKHIGAGVGTWNIRQYKVLNNNGRVYINNDPLIFYHFVGLKIYYPLPPLIPASLKGYGEISKNRTLIYEPYFLELYKQLRMVQRYISDFKLGFEPRPNIIVSLKEGIVASIIYFKKHIN